MTITAENYNGVRFFKANGVTRVIWMPRRGLKSTIHYKNGILVVGLCGFCMVFAPFRP